MYKTKIIDVDFRDSDSVNQHFKPRLDWHPFGENSKTFFVDWNTWDNNFVTVDGEQKFISPTNVRFNDRGMVLSTVNMSPVITENWGLHEFCYKGAEVVTKDSFEVGRFELIADVPITERTVPAMWFLSTARWVEGGIHTIKAEFDSHEFGVEHFPTDLNCAFHFNYLYDKYENLDGVLRERIDNMPWYRRHLFTEPQQRSEHFPVFTYDYSGEHLFWSEIRDNLFIAGVDDEEIWRQYRPRRYRIPMYAIMWHAVPSWANLNEGEVNDLTLKSFKVYM